MSLELAQLQQQVRDLHARLELSETRSRRERRRLRFQGSLAFAALIGAIVVSPGNRAAIAQGYGVTIQQLASRLTVVEGKTQFVSVTGGEMFVKGTNFHIENGLPDPGLDTSGRPNAPTLNGKGNLIVGYNTPIGFGADVRTGSHNLIVGNWNNFSSYGGVVFGLQNTISAPYACVSGGIRNTASGFYSSVGGGELNKASGQYSSASGGYFNNASGFYSSVSGGYLNKASGQYSSASGGTFNTASGQYSSVSGGAINTASSDASSVSGGYFGTNNAETGWTGGSYHSP